MQYTVTNYKVKNRPPYLHQKLTLSGAFATFTKLCFSLQSKLAHKSIIKWL